MTKWKDDEVASLRAWLGNGESVDAIAEALGRSKDSVDLKARSLDLIVAKAPASHHVSVQRRFVDANMEAARKFRDRMRLEREGNAA